MRNFCRQASLAVGFLLLLGSTAVEAKVDPEKIPRWEMQCRSGDPGTEYCTPVDCNGWCAGKDAGWQCESGLFEGNLQALLACCHCNAPTTHQQPGGTPEVVKSCSSSSDCPAGYVCRVSTKLKPPREPLPGADTGNGTCVRSVIEPTPVEPTGKACVTDAQCGVGFNCVKGRCFQVQ